jgi:hypothetical protein
MKLVRRIVVWVMALLLVLGGGIYGASELGGEIVTLTTRDANDGDASTRLWVVDDNGAQYLRAGDPGSGWLQRIQANPQIVVERNGVATTYTGVPVTNDPGQPARIHALMRDKYGWADRVVSVLGDRSQSIAVRLDPAAPTP